MCEYFTQNHKYGPNESQRIGKVSRIHPLSVRTKVTDSASRTVELLLYVKPTAVGVLSCCTMLLLSLALRLNTTQERTNQSQ